MSGCQSDGVLGCSCITTTLWKLLLGGSHMHTCAVH